jgi:hypothetical protein
MPSIVAMGLAWVAACDDGADASAQMHDASTGDGVEAPNATKSTDDPPGAEEACDGEGACAGEGLCEAYPCGGRPARFNHFGCRRVSCSTDADCPSGEACFTIAYERICEPSSTTCTEEGGACRCEATDDCNGIAEGHCLPTQFYPPSEYCDPSLFSCEDLESWAAALEQAAGATDESLAAGLRSCAEQARERAGACP